MTWHSELRPTIDTVCSSTSSPLSLRVSFPVKMRVVNLFCENSTSRKRADYSCGATFPVFDRCQGRPFTIVSE